MEGDAEIQPAGDQQFLDLAAAQVAHGELHARVARAEGGHRVGHEARKEGGDHAHLERAGLQRAHVGHGLPPGFQLLQRARCVVAKGVARLGQAQPAPQAVKERHAQLGLQLAQAVRERGLRDE